MTQSPPAKLDLVVPFYKNPNFVADVATNLRELACELQPFVGTVYWINDYPSSPELALRLEVEARQLRDVLNVVVLTNSANQGFVKSSNRGLRRAVKAHHHVLLLNSDAVILPGAVRAMWDLLHADPMVGFVNPRSNNATIACLPQRLPADMARDQDVAFAAFKELSQHLREYQYVPTCVGFCLLIRNTVLQEFGLFDEAYGRGYHEENDLIYRANRHGYSSVLCNRAYVFHHGMQSFSKTQKDRYGGQNSVLLHDRYPEYQRSIEKYLDSPQYKYELLLSGCYVQRKRYGKPSVLIDCLHIVEAHNGTFLAAREIIRALSEVYGGYKFVVLCDPRVASFHGFDRIGPSVCVEPPGTKRFFDVYLKVGQPFTACELVRASTYALHVVHIMLDTIAWDCHYLRTDQLSGIWDFVASLNDGVLFNSQFTRERFLHRFPQMGQRLNAVCGHSLYYGDYLRDRVTDAELPVPPEGAWTQHILVFGNHYKHKFLQRTVDALLRSKPDICLWALGLVDEHPAPNVQSLPSGKVSAAYLEGLYATASAVVFPSLYEGFGLPLAEALARDKLVFARRSSLNEELRAAWEGPGTLHLYESTDHLVRLFESLGELHREHLAASASFVPIEAHESHQSWHVVARRIGAMLATILDPKATTALALARLQHPYVAGDAHEVPQATLGEALRPWLRSAVQPERFLRQKERIVQRAQGLRRRVGRYVLLALGH